MAYSDEFRKRMLEKTSSLESSFNDSEDTFSRSIGGYISTFRNDHQKREQTVHLLYSCRKLVEDILYIIIDEVGDASDDFAKNIKMVSELNVFGPRNNNVVALVDSIRRISDVFNHKLSHPEELDYEICGCMTDSIKLYIS